MKLISLLSTTVLITLLFSMSAAAGERVFATDTITFSYSETAELKNGNLITSDDAVWRMMESEVQDYEGPAVILNQRGSRSGIAYFNGKSVPVTLLSGEPGLNEGFRTSLLMADQEQRRLLLADGTTRRVLDPDADLDFPGGSLVEIIITRDRRHAIDLSRGYRIAVSPPVRN
ncbi:MAG: hypothetical protein LAT84_09605 [Balneolia bacterium]|nr:hypothetical protein [Balneolia bacterium]